MGAILTVKNVDLAGPAEPGFRGLDFEVAPGQALGIAELGSGDLGRLLDVLAGLEAPRSGEITWNGVTSASRERAATSRRRYRMERKLRLEVGFLSASASLLQNRTLEENIALPLRYHFRFREAEVAGRVSRLLTLLKLAPEARWRPAGLSPGMHRRAELARALILEPKLLVLESPFTNVERESVRILVAALKEFQSERAMGILVASHDPLQLALVVSRILVYSDGKLSGSLEDRELADQGLLADRTGLLRTLERKSKEQESCGPPSAE
jgi:ABC-type sulfate/molybdate transport systems ATPase subunit